MRKLTLCGFGLIVGLAACGFGLMMELAGTHTSWASITCFFDNVTATTYPICGDSVDAFAETGDPFCPGFSDIPCECGDDVRSSTSLDPADDPVVDGTPCGGNGLSVTVKDNILLDCQSNTLRGTPGNFGTGLIVSGVSGVFLKKCGDVDFDTAAVIAYSNDVTIDCGSATWRGNFFDDGIILFNVTTATIKNCEVKFFVDGIHATESDLITMNSVKSKFNFFDGVHFDNVTSSTVKASFLQDNGDDGIELHENDGNTVQGTRIERNAYGVFLNGAHNDKVLNNQINNNLFQGVLAEGDSDDNVISDNVITGNDVGIRLTDDANGNTLSGNNANKNFEEGIELEPSGDSPDGNFILNNKTEQNGDDGIGIESSDNTVSGNRGQKNGGNGLEVDGGSGNALANNNFSKNSGHGICTEVGTASDDGGNTGSDNATPPNVIFGAVSCD